MPFKDPEKRRAMARKYAKRTRERHPERQAARMRKWRSENKEHAYAKSREYLKGIRLTAIETYSNGTMACKHCNYSNVDALCIDHIADNGKAHREEVGTSGSFWLWLKRNNYPEGFQVLCHNCNFLKELTRRRNKTLAKLVTERLP